MTFSRNPSQYKPSVHSLDLQPSFQALDPAMENELSDGWPLLTGINSKWEILLWRTKSEDDNIVGLRFETGRDNGPHNGQWRLQPSCHHLSKAVT